MALISFRRLAYPYQPFLFDNYAPFFSTITNGIFVFLIILLVVLQSILIKFMF